MNPPITPRKKRTRLWVVLGIIAVLLALAGVTAGFAGYGAYRLFAKGEFFHRANRMFAEQDLKTAVALIELHRVRTGHYPKSLKDLRYLGPWDAGFLQNVRYVAAPDQKSYYVEVEPVFAGGPRPQLPPGFWRGTGFNPKLARDLKREPGESARTTDGLEPTPAPVKRPRAAVSGR